MNKTELLSLINSLIKENTSGEITAPILNSILTNIVEYASSLATQNDVYTKSEVDTMLSAKADANHTHTPASIGAAAASHTHAPSDLPTASTSAYGLVKVGTGIAVSGGVLNVATATTSSYGMVKIGNGLNTVNGVVSVPSATTSQAGIVRLGIGNNLAMPGNSGVTQSVFNSFTASTGTRFNNYATTAHTHDDRYYTKEEIDNNGTN